MLIFKILSNDSVFFTTITEYLYMYHTMLQQNMSPSGSSFNHLSLSQSFLQLHLIITLSQNFIIIILFSVRIFLSLSEPHYLYQNLYTSIRISLSLSESICQNFFICQNFSYLSEFLYLCHNHLSLSEFLYLCKNLSICRNFSISIRTSLPLSEFLYLCSSYCLPPSESRYISLS
jgi:hypothetical protein